MLVALALVDFLLGAAALDSGPPIVAGATIGTIAGQLALLAGWAVVGPQRLLVRWPLALLATASLLSASVLGQSVASLRAYGVADIDSPFAQWIAFLPIVFLAVQLPVWVLKLATGCRMVLDPGDGGPQPPRSRQFRVRDLLVVTTVVAVSLGLARLGLSDFGSAQRSVDTDSLAGLAVFCGVAALWSGFVAMPCLYAALVARHVRKGVLGITGYTILMSLVIALVLSPSASNARVSVGAAPLALGKIFGFFLFVNGSTVFVVFGSFLIARADGYVLLCPRRVKGETKLTADSSLPNESTASLADDGP